ncbi:hypothetical protein [Aquimarina rubra]|uniref:Uncharacterized protein n=1 Tax=Aquimarina rubra TaxID=1920033 RepID=A0ABW5LDZ8_9FLAO
MKYRITQEDLKKRSYGISFDMMDDEFLRFIQKEKELNNPFLSEANIQKLEKDTLRNIHRNIYTYGLFGIISMGYGLFILFNFEPRVAVNLYTQFPLIENGSIPIVLGFGFIIGSLYSYKKKNEVLVTKVKSKIIEYLKEVQKEKLEKSSYQYGKKKTNTHLQPKKRQKRK